MTSFEPLEVRRLFAFGTVTPGFGYDGATTTPMTGDSGFIDATTFANGKILIGAGGGLARLNADGLPDAAFGTDGVAQFKSISFRDRVVDGYGRIYVLATGNSGTLVRRYTADGQVDYNFAHGSASVEPDSTFQPVALDLQPDGKVVVAGTFAADATRTDTHVYRLKADGTMDTAFGYRGCRTLTLSAPTADTPMYADRVADVRIMSNGKIEVLGSGTAFYDGEKKVDGLSTVALARLDADGTVDQTFAYLGVARRQIYSTGRSAIDTGVILADGSAVAATTLGTTTFVAFTASGGTDYTSAVPATNDSGKPVDTAVLPDGRVAFVNDAGRIWTVSADGTVSNSVRPVAVGKTAANAVAATPTGDLLLVDVSAAGVRVVGVDAGRASDARPDVLPAAGAVASAVDDLGGLHVAFFDAATGTLKYAYRDPNGYWNGIRTVDATPGAGAAVGIDTAVIRGKVNVSLAYYASGTADLRFALSSTFGKKFALETVASKGSVGQSPSIKMIASGGYAISYYGKSAGSLFYSQNTGHGWATDVVDTGGAGASNELQYDAATGTAAIAYAGPKNTVWYAARTAKGTFAAGRQKVATTAGGAAYVNLSDAGASPKIGYYDGASADFVVASRQSGKSGVAWQATAVASRGAVGAFNDVIARSSGLSLLAWSKAANTVYQFDYARFPGTATTTAVLTDSGKNLSVAASNAGVIGALIYTDPLTGQTLVR